jgi:soluble lytic murein transglycosylase-like protein
MQESGMDPNAPHNPGDGYGMMQVLSSTFAKYGHGDINNPQDNLDAGMSKLQALGKTYPGDERSMARAYNGSAGNPKAEQYADSVMSRMGNVTVNIYPQTDDPKAHGEAAAEALLKKMSQRSQVNSNVVYVI